MLSTVVAVAIVVLIARILMLAGQDALPAARVTSDAPVVNLALPLPTVIPPVRPPGTGIDMPSVTFTNGVRAIHLPIRGVVRRPSSDLGVLPELTALLPEEVLLIALERSSRQVLDFRAGQARGLAIYVGDGDRVTYVSNSFGPRARANDIAPYRIAVLGLMNTPNLIDVAADDRIILDDPTGRLGFPALLAPERIPIPPVGTVAAYPPPTGATPLPRPTQPGAYPRP
ncbi:MAG: hypothetical protein EPO26_15135 [Chloroflexota bacterium]|nr:MAG: hypothetical protein EPO26_15135 [Chloroflexota bacterium]